MLHYTQLLRYTQLLHYTQSSHYTDLVTFKSDYWDSNFGIKNRSNSN